MKSYLRPIRLVGFTPATQILDREGRDWSWAFVVFRPVPGFPGYAVDSRGNLWSNHSTRRNPPEPGRWKQLRFNKVRGGYLQATLYRDGVAHKAFVSHLVLRAFVGECPGGMEACHFPNRDRTDNRPANLRWDTKKANSNDRRLQGTMPVGERHQSAKYSDELISEIREKKRLGFRNFQLSKMYGIRDSYISAIVMGKSRSHSPEARP